jgi:hypothetical protein
VILEILYASFHPSEFKNALGEWDFWIGTDVDNENGGYCESVRVKGKGVRRTGGRS